MKFSAVVEQASALLQRKERITYRALKREFTLDDDALADLTFELITRGKSWRSIKTARCWSGSGREKQHRSQPTLLLRPNLPSVTHPRIWPSVFAPSKPRWKPVAPVRGSVRRSPRC